MDELRRTLREVALAILSGPAARIVPCTDFTRPPSMNARTFSTTVLFVLGISCAVAQERAPQPSDAMLQSCLLGTPATTWTSLKLTRDQTERVKRVQEACKEECEAAGAEKPADSISHATGSTVIEELKSILDEGQYRAWLSYCAQAGKAGPK